MDEFMFRSTQTVENLQIQLGLSLQQSKVLFQQYAERGMSLANDALHSPRLSQLHDVARELLERLIEMMQRGKETMFVVFDPKQFYDGVLRLMRSEMSRSHITCGCIGFIVGGLAGYLFANMWHKPVRCVTFNKAVACTSYGDIDCVALLDDVPSPHIGAPDDVLVQVKASCVSATDIEICRGYGKRIRKILSRFNNCLQSQFPIILGRGCSGIVLEIGQRVSRFDIGDEVFLTAPYWAQGTTCETVVAKDFRVGHKPKRIGFEGAAGVAYAGSIALTVVQDSGITKDNALEKRVLVCGACTPVGCAIIQYCHLLGAEITATCTMQHAPVAKALGVDDVILIQEYSKSKTNLEMDTRHHLKKELELREPYDLVFITTETGLTKHELRMRCKEDGRLLSTIPEFLPSDHFGFVFGGMFWSYIRTRCLFQSIFGWQHRHFGEPDLNYSQLEVLADLIDNKKMQSVVDKVFQVYDIGTMLDHVQSSEAIGSSIVTFR